MENIAMVTEIRKCCFFHLWCDLTICGLNYRRRTDGGSYYNYCKCNSALSEPRTVCLPSS